MTRDQKWEHCKGLLRSSPNDKYRLSICPGPLGCKRVEHQFYGSADQKGEHGDPTVRYLQLDGSWDETAEYFDTPEEVLSLIYREVPHFELTPEEAEHQILRKELCSLDPVEP